MNRLSHFLSVGLLLLSALSCVPVAAQSGLSLQRMSYGDVTVEILMPAEVKSKRQVLQSPVGTVPARVWGSSQGSSFSVANSLVRYGEVLEEGYTLQSLPSTVRQQLMDNMVENMVADFPEGATTTEKIEQQGYNGRRITIASKDTGILIRLLLIEEVMSLGWVAYTEGQESLARRVLRSYRVVK